MDFLMENKIVMVIIALIAVGIVVGLIKKALKVVFVLAVILIASLIWNSVKASSITPTKEVSWRSENILVNMEVEDTDQLGLYLFK